MPTTVDPQPGSPPDDAAQLSDEEILERCHDIERRRRADLAEHLRLLRQLEARRLYYADGHRDLAGFGRAEYRWADRDAKAHRDLERLCRECPQIVQQLTIGRIGTAQAFLLARLSRAPRVGMHVAEQIDDFLDHAATLSYLAFEQYVLAWKCLMDQDGPDPDRAHRNRKASLTQTGLLGRFDVEGPAVDLARLKVLMAHFEEIEFRRDWAAAKQQWGDDISVDRLARSVSQRRYDAFQSLVDHVTLPKMPTFSDADFDDATPCSSESGSDSAPDSDADAATDPSAPDASAPDTATGPTAGSSGSPVETVLNIVIDGETFLHALHRLLGIHLDRAVRSPFGPDRAFCQTFDGDPIAVRDAVLAGIAGKVRLVLRGPDGVPTTMSSASRLFTGAVRDAVLMTATHCTHPGCIVPATTCQIDHLHPHHRGGVTAAWNGAIGCGHHNRWRHAAKVVVVRMPDGTIATYRPNGSRIAPPV